MKAHFFARGSNNLFISAFSKFNSKQDYLCLCVVITVSFLCINDFPKFLKLSCTVLLQCLLELIKENELLEKLMALLCDVSENRNHYASGTQDVHAAGALTFTSPLCKPNNKSWMVKPRNFLRPVFLLNEDCSRPSRCAALCGLPEC